MHSESAAARDESQLVEALKQRDEEAFADFVVKHAATMRRVAAAVTRNAVLAEEAVQDTWLAVLKGIGRFEARASLRTWIFRILVNRARTLVARESRSRPLPGENDEVPEQLFRYPDDVVLRGELRDIVRGAVGRLPAAQAEVITLRDIEGWDAAEVCSVLGLTEVNQRVLLHRARAKVRAVLEAYLPRR